LWVAWYPFRKIERLDSFLEVVRQSPLGRIVRAYSGLVIAAFATKFFLFTCYNTFADWWDATPLTRFLGLYVAPHDLPLWQMAAFVNATLAIGFFVFAREALVRIKNGMAWPETIVVRLFRSATFVRCLLSLYTIACTLFITVRAASLFHFPGIGTNLFPWSQL
jgi:hypothetical protein